LKNKNELVDINGTLQIYCTQIYRINYKKYSIYKEWDKIKSFLQRGLNTESTQNISNSNYLTGDIEEKNDNEAKKQNFDFRKVELTNKQITQNHQWFIIINSLFLISLENFCI